MRIWMLAIACVLLNLTLTVSCGGSAVEPPDPGTAATGPALTGEAEMAEIPGLDALAEPDRELSIAGPGWFTIDPKQTVRRAGGQPSLPGQIILAAASSPAYAIYGVRGFDGDMMPTSYRLDLAGVTGEYFLAISDYTAGQWRFLGHWDEARTIEIPLLSEYSAADAYTSPQGWHYFAIIIPTGGGLTINGVELGVHGGQDVTGSAGSLFGAGGENGFYLMWAHSAHYLKPDFAGYVIERAPILGGEFTRLTPAPVMACWFEDPTAELDTVYRYRVAEVDTTGNLGPWSVCNDGPVTGEPALPMVNVTLPRSHYYGPAQVTFDLSESFDPEGQALTEYGVKITNSPIDITGADPVINVTLQPGTYFVLLNAAAGARSNVIALPVAVYPRWQDQSYLVRDPDQCTLSRALFLRAGRLPATGQLVFAGADPTSHGLFIWCENEAGTGFRPYPVPAYIHPFDCIYGVDGIGEPTVIGDTLYFPFSGAAYNECVAFDGENATAYPLCLRSTSPAFALAADGDGHLWYFYQADTGGTLVLRAAQLGAAGSVVELFPDLLAGLLALDVAYNPASNSFCIVFRNDTGAGNDVHWTELNPETLAVGVSAVIGASTINGPVDLEINPATQQPCVIFRQSSGVHYYHVYRQYEGGGTWSPGAPIDDTSTNSYCADLIAANGTVYASFGLLSGVTNLYEWNSGWTVRNSCTAPFLAPSELALVAEPASAAFTTFGRVPNGEIFIERLESDGTDTFYPWSLPATEGQGQELHGTAGSDGIHLVWNAATSQLWRHVSSADGEAWAIHGDLPDGGVSLDISSTSTGEVYASGVHPLLGTAELYYWDGGDFHSRLSYPGCHIHTRPLLSRNPLSNQITWVVDQEVPPHAANYVTGNESLGLTTVNVPLVHSPIWVGAALPGLGLIEQRYVMFAGGMNWAEGTLGYFVSNGSALDPVFQPIVGFPYNFLTANEVWGRTIDTSVYMGPRVNEYCEVYWTTHDNLMTPRRYSLQHPLFGHNSIAYLEMETEPYQAEVRRTVSSEITWGVSAVTLMADLWGDDVLFEWSNFGDWEELQLPDGMDYMSKPELVVGRDGRWHIIYRNYCTDQIMCRSTL
ncbi:hypothetical protein JW859_03960 [bacterium]|nr:hypothetical protein [bacterium]